jgi:hypothetical protein
LAAKGKIMATSTVHFAPCHQEEAGMLSLGDDAIVSELKAAGASLVLALAAAQNGDWAAAEQGAIDAQQRAAVILRQIQLKLAEPPGPGGETDEDEPSTPAT